MKCKVTDFVETKKNEYIITLKASACSDGLKKLLQDKEQDVDVEIKKWHEARSLNANAYCWVLCDKIAEKIKSTKELVYKEVIKNVGVFDILPIKVEAVDIFVKRWESRGIGWFCEVMRESKLKGYMTLMVYYGSSTYNTKEMARLIDEIVAYAKELEIQTKTPAEIEELKSLWSSYEL